MGQGRRLSSFTGASRQGLSHKEVGIIRLPLPGVEVQHDIVAALEKQEKHRKHVRDSIEAQINTLFAYRKSLIYECVAGKRRITEAHLKEIEAHV
jgi:type I restriction enzyme S subunit